MLYEKKLLFLCSVDLVIHEKMDCVSDQDATPCTDLSVCAHTQVDPTLSYGPALPMVIRH